MFNRLYDSAKSELLKFVSKLGIKIVILIGTFSLNVLIIVLTKSSSSSDYYRWMVKIAYTALNIVIYVLLYRR